MAVYLNGEEVGVVNNVETSEGVDSPRIYTHYLKVNQADGLSTQIDFNITYQTTEPNLPTTNSEFKTILRNLYNTTDYNIRLPIAGIVSGGHAIYLDLDTVNNLSFYYIKDGSVLQLISTSLKFRGQVI